MRILVVDDEKKVRSSLKVLLNQQPGWQVVGEGSNSNEAVDQNQELEPDLVLLDWGIPGVPTSELIPRLSHGNSPPIIIVFSGRIEVKAEALNAGACAFIGKTSPPTQLVETIRSVSKDQKGGEK